MTITIEHFCMMGDSLSDRGTMGGRKLLYFIPMAGLSGLGKSPKKRFTNGYNWADELAAFVSEDGIITKLERRGQRSDDIADDIIDHDPRVEKPLQTYFNLDDDRFVNYRGQDYIRSYDEGGLTAYDYSTRITFNLKLLAEDQILATLDEKRHLMLGDDKARGISAEHKKKTMVIEWSGANDLVTINENPTEEEADKAVAARIRNVNSLIKHGYYHFSLFNLPDFSLTPRFQRLTKDKQDNARKVSAYFNVQLAAGVAQLTQDHSGCSIDVFDINTIFMNAYTYPEQFGLDRTKLKQPFTEIQGFNVNTSLAKGYMFWDDVHPTAAVQAVLGNEFYKKYSSKYHFSAPHESLLEVFRETYGQKLEDDKRGFFGYFRRSRLNYKNATLDDILEHPLYNGGQRTREVITELGWIDKQGQLISTHFLLVAAMEKMQSSPRERRCFLC